MADWTSAAIGLTGTIVGAVSSGGIAWLSWTYTEKTRTSQLRLQKLEQLYQVLIRIRQHYVELYGHITVRLAADVDEPAHSEDGPIPFAEMKMLVAIYAAELGDHVTQIMIGRDEFGKILCDMMSVTDTPLFSSARENLDKEAQAVSTRFSETIERAMTATAEIAQKEMS